MATRQWKAQTTDTALKGINATCERLAKRMGIDLPPIPMSVRGNDPDMLMALRMDAIHKNLDVLATMLDVLLDPPSFVGEAFGVSESTETPETPPQGVIVITGSNGEEATVKTFQETLETPETGDPVEDDATPPPDAETGVTAPAFDPGVVIPPESHETPSDPIGIQAAGRSTKPPKRAGK